MFASKLGCKFLMFLILVFPIIGNTRIRNILKKLSMSLHFKPFEISLPTSRLQQIHGHPLDANADKKNQVTYFKICIKVYNYQAREGRGWPWVSHLLACSSAK